MSFVISAPLASDALDITNSKQRYVVEPMTVLVDDAEAQTATDESAPFSNSNRANLGSIQRTAVDEVATEEDPLTRQDESSDHDGIDAAARVERNGSETIYVTPTGRMPRLWLFDRCDGTSKYNPESRPPCRGCWAPFIIKWCPDILEQNCICESVGRRGCIDPENTRVRRRLFLSAFIINVIGLLLLVVSSFSISKHHFYLVWRAEFTNVWLNIVKGPTSLGNHILSWRIGLRAVAYQNIFSGYEGLFSYAELCQLQNEVYKNSTLFHEDPTVLLLMEANPGKFDCSSCEDISRKIVPSLFLSMLSYIPNFTTDILRMYSNYDVNCQKFMASTSSWISLATSLYTWVNYRRGCFDSLNLDPFAVNENFQKVNVDSEDAFLVVEFNWQAGLGQICLLAATLLKIIDIAINIVLPTPTITRDHQEQVDYEWRYGQVVENDDEPNDNFADSLKARKSTSECSSRMEIEDEPNDNKAYCPRTRNATSVCSSRLENDDEPNDDKPACPSPRARNATFECSSRD